jgi:putative membrane protein
MAWVRTGIAVMGLGFLVARFGFFLMLVNKDVAQQSQQFATIIGVSLVALGAIAIAGSAWQQGRYVKKIPAADLPEGYKTSWSIILAATIAVAGLFLAGYLYFQ